jgi:muramoyltetrapeptide carboxypeptidase
MAWLKARYRLSFEPGLFARHGFLAGSDARRLSELAAAVSDPSVDAIVTARGGHGLLRIVQAVPWGRLREHPKWIVGFSDPTALHSEAWKVGVVSLHAANVAGLGRAHEGTRAEWLRCLEAPDEVRTITGVGLVPGRVRGPVVGGNLTVLTMLATANRLQLPSGCILLLEDVTETSYRIDRMLAALRLGGHLDRVAAIAFGEFTDCGSGLFRVPVDAVLQEFVAGSLPAVGALPVGHGARNVPVHFGAVATLDGSNGTLTFGV